LNQALGLVGLVLMVAASMLIVQGAWMAFTGRRPPWMKYQYPPAGRERGFGSALIVVGAGGVLQGASYIEPAFSILRVIGLALFVVGGAFAIVIFRPRPWP
jgi:hypothetical protein